MRCCILTTLLAVAGALRGPTAAQSRRAVLASAAALPFTPAAHAFDLPSLEAFDDPKARKASAQRPNPSLQKQQSSAFYAVSTFDVSSLRSMADAGWALADAKDSAGKTVLHRAAQVGNTDAVAILLGSGSQVDAKTQWKETPLHMASRGGKLAAVKQLVEAGASTSAKTYGGDTALDLAQKYKMAPVIEYLSSK